MQYHKLVRDKIPQLIEAKGEKPLYHILSEPEYIACLEQKLDEEVAEYHSDKNAEELADILEVVLSLGRCMGISQEQLLQICDAKRKERGGFEKRIFLIEKK